MTPNDPPVCKLCKTNSKMILHGTEWVCHGTHALDPMTTERPTPLTDAACGFHDIDTAVDADFARTLERSLAERTEERDNCNTAYRLAKENQELLIAQRDEALAKLAKCRTTLEWVSESRSSTLARQTLKETE